jgi:hypothetical protein
MWGHAFYNQTTRRYVAVFGTLFNDILIRRTGANNDVSNVKVPIAYGPTQKFLSKIEQDPDFAAPAMVSPRISFEMVSLQYDGERKLTDQIVIVNSIPNQKAMVRSRFMPAPYNLEFTMSIMAKNMEDGLKVLEQILPFFKPHFTTSVNILDGMDEPIDIPIILNSVQMQDSYEGSYDERRTLIWTLNFTMKAYYYGPTSDKKIIKFVTVNTYDGLNKEEAVAVVNIQPGLTANGNPTTNITQTIPYSQIGIDEDWDYIVTITESE